MTTPNYWTLLGRVEQERNRLRKEVERLQTELAVLEATNKEIGDMYVQQLRECEEHVGRLRVRRWSGAGARVEMSSTPRSDEEQRVWDAMEAAKQRRREWDAQYEERQRAARSRTDWGS